MDTPDISLLVHLNFISCSKHGQNIYSEQINSYKFACIQLQQMVESWTMLKQLHTKLQAVVIKKKKRLLDKENPTKAHTNNIKEISLDM